MLIKSHRIDDSSSSDTPSESLQPEGGVKSSGMIILRYMPKSFGKLFGFDQEDDTMPMHMLGGDEDVEKKREPQHLLGGKDDVDKKRMHLLGGDDDVDMKRIHLLGGEGDPDRIRLDMDENNKGVFTGGNDEVFSNNMDKHR